LKAAQILGTWLYRVAYNASMDRLRQRQTEPVPDEDTEDNKNLPRPAVFIEWQTPEIILMNNEHRTQMQATKSHLPHGLRVIFVLRDIEELSTRETAQVLGLEEGTVKGRLHRARLLLRERLSVYFLEYLSTS
jgi:RNA polymerase sigma-70 factor (ECF subfamily)